MTSSGPSPRKIKRVEEDLTNSDSSDDDDQQDGLAETTRQALSDLHDCQNELNALHRKGLRANFQVKTKYNKLRKPHYDKRATFIEKIPNLWHKAILKNPKVQALLDDGDGDCLQFLKKLEVEELENADDGFRIKFIFYENPFFENEELVKEFQLDPYGELINKFHRGF